jgi:hypothetical protein
LEVFGNAVKALEGRVLSFVIYRSTMLNFTGILSDSEYNESMARGWESKSVEAQIEAKPANGNHAPRSRTPDQVQHLIEKRNLELARAKVAHELELSQSERYSHMLQQSLSELDKKIEAVSGRERSGSPLPKS